MFKINFSLLIYITILALVTAGCSTSSETKTEENTNSNSGVIAETTETTETTDNSFCPVMESRNWQAWIDRVAEDKPRLNISGEVDLPTPGYKVEWQPGILDRRNPPAQRISISFIPPEGIVAQVITPTEVSFTMRSPILKYRSVAIYCGDKLLADIPDVMPRE